MISSPVGVTKLTEKHFLSTSALMERNWVWSWCGSSCVINLISRRYAGKCINCNSWLVGVERILWEKCWRLEHVMSSCMDDSLPIYMDRRRGTEEQQLKMDRSLNIVLDWICGGGGGRELCSKAPDCDLKLSVSIEYFISREYTYIHRLVGNIRGWKFGGVGEAGTHFTMNWFFYRHKDFWVWKMKCCRFIYGGIGSNGSGREFIPGDAYVLIMH